MKIKTPHAKSYAMQKKVVLRKKFTVMNPSINKENRS